MLSWYERGIYHRERTKKIEMLLNGFLFLMPHALQTTTGTFSLSLSAMAHKSLMVDLDEPLVSVASQHYMQACY